MWYCRKFLSIYNLKFIPLVLHVVMLMFLVIQGAYLDNIIIYRYASIMLFLIAVYFILYSLELKKNKIYFTIQIIIAIGFTLISLNYLLRSFNINFLW